MQVTLPVTAAGYLPDAYSKYAPTANKIDDYPVVSPEVTLTAIPAGTTHLAVVMLDHDAIPVCGFSWIHWTVANVPVSGPTMTLPADFSRQAPAGVVQGLNSFSSPDYAERRPTVTHGYMGPIPPDKDHDYQLRVYALAAPLAVTDGCFANAIYAALAAQVPLAVAQTAVRARV